MDDLIKNDERLIELKKLIEKIKKDRNLQHIDILPLEELRELKILDIHGQFGYEKFINAIIAE